MCAGPAEEEKAADTGASLTIVPSSTGGMILGVHHGDPVLPAGGAKLYEDKIMKCRHFLNVSFPSSSTYLIE